MKENVAFLIQNWDYEILQFCGDEYKESEEIMNKGIRTFYRNTTLFLFLYEYWKQSHIPYFDLILRQDLRKFGEKFKSECYQMISGLIKRQDQQARER